MVGKTIIVTMKITQNRLKLKGLIRIITIIIKCNNSSYTDNTKQAQIKKEDRNYTIRMEISV